MRRRPRHCEHLKAARSVGRAANILLDVGTRRTLAQNPPVATDCIACPPPIDPAQRVEYLGRYEGLIRLDSITAGEVNPDARCLRIYARKSSHKTTPDNHAHHVCGLSQICGYSATGTSSQHPWSSTIGSGDAGYLSRRCHSKPTEAPLLRDGTAVCGRSLPVVRNWLNRLLPSGRGEPGEGRLCLAGIIQISIPSRYRPIMR